MKIIAPKHTMESWQGYENVYFVIDTHRRLAYFTQEASLSQSGVVVVDLGKHEYSEITSYYRTKAKGLVSFAHLILFGHNEQFHL
jgi:hypothetical protein